MRKFSLVEKLLIVTLLVSASLVDAEARRRHRYRRPPKYSVAASSRIQKVDGVAILVYVTESIPRSRRPANADKKILALALKSATALCSTVGSTTQHKNIYTISQVHQNMRLKIKGDLSLVRTNQYDTYTYYFSRRGYVRVPVSRITYTYNAECGS